MFREISHKGIGNKILDAAEKKATEMSEKVQLGVGLHSGYGSAQRIYIKRGYIPDGSVFGITMNRLRSMLIAKTMMNWFCS